MVFGSTRLMGGVALALGLVAGCSSDDTPSVARGNGEGGAAGTGSTEPTTLEIFSWWTEGGEQDALEAVLAVHEANTPGVTVINAAEEYADKARETLETRMGAGNPPDTFQANIGADLLRWVGATDGETAIESLDALAADEGWRDAFPPALIDAASKDGVLYGVPLNVHRINALFYNKRLFDEFGLTPPTTIEELNILVETIKTDPDIQASNPGGVAPLALGNQWNWTMSMLTFEAMLPAIAGPDYYESFWAGEADPTDPEITDTLSEMLFLYCGADPATVCDGYFNADVDTVDWPDGVQMLRSGTAAMAFMGDWAKGFLEEPLPEQNQEAWVANVDFGVVPFPGSVGTFVYTADTFPLPKGAPNPEAARALLVTFGSPDGQVAFNAVKGSIPARSDIDLAAYPDEFDDMHRATAADFKDGRLVLALSGILPSGKLEDMAPELKASLQAGTTEIIQNYLINNYDSLK